MFMDNKYTRWYYKIIESAQTREDVVDYVERHHIIPKCMGGDESYENMAHLTAREHYICHWLLTKMTSGVNRRNMTFSLHTFFHFNKNRRLNFKSRQYEYHRIRYSEACSNRAAAFHKKDTFVFRCVDTEETFTGTRKSFREYSGLTPQDVNWLIKYCIKPDDSKKIIKGWSIWIEELGKFSNEKHRPACAVNDLPSMTCEHCHKTVSFGNYHRWHGSRCKKIDQKGHHERTRQVAYINKRR